MTRPGLGEPARQGRLQQLEAMGSPEANLALRTRGRSEEWAALWLVLTQGWGKRLALVGRLRIAFVFFSWPWFSLSPKFQRVLDWRLFTVPYSEKGMGITI